MPVNGTPSHKNSPRTLNRYSLSENATFDYIFKVIVLGDQTVGKTCFLNMYTSETYADNYAATVGIDCQHKTVKTSVGGEESKVKLQLWDTAGQERYHAITTAYFRGANGFVLVYDITSEQSFKSVYNWATQINEHSADEKTYAVLVGNKCDLSEKRVVSYEQGRKLAKELGYGFFEASAKDNMNVYEVFDMLISKICKNKRNGGLDGNRNLVGGRKNTIGTTVALNKPTFLNRVGSFCC